MSEPLFTLYGTPVTLLRLLIFVGILLLSFLVAKGVARATKKISPSSYGLSRLIYYVIFLVGFYIALVTIGIDLTGIAVVVGALSVGIGFGLQAIFNNFIAGVIVLLEKKIHLGDFIDLQSGDCGEVIEVNVRTTVIRAFDGQKIVVPNTDIIAKRIIVGGDMHRIVIPFSVSSEMKKEEVRKLALESAHQDHGEVWLKKLSETVADYELIIWTSEKKAVAPYLWDLEERFSREQIKILFV